VTAEQVVGIALAAMAAAFNALAFYLLRLHWQEISDLRKSRAADAVTLTTHALRLDALDGGRMRRCSDVAAGAGDD
jgi:uncharacterized membrane protein